VLLLNVHTAMKQPHRLCSCGENEKAGEIITGPDRLVRNALIGRLPLVPAVAVEAWHPSTFECGAVSDTHSLNSSICGFTKWKSCYRREPL